MEAQDLKHPLRSAAHNFAHSFCSLLNYGHGNYVMTYLAHATARSGEPELLLTGAAEPAPLLTESAFSHERAVLHAGRWSLAPLYYPPYGPRMRRIADLVSRWMERW